MPNHSLIENLLLVCNAIIISRSTNLSVMKDYLPQLWSLEPKEAKSELVAPLGIR